jgi:hypothetical protein
MVGWPAKRSLAGGRTATTAVKEASVLDRAGYPSPKQDACLGSVPLNAVVRAGAAYGPGSAVASIRTGFPAPPGLPVILSPGRRPSIVVETALSSAPALIVVSPKRSE